MDEEAVKEAFARLRPVCVLLTKECSRRNVANMQHVLETTDSSVLQELQEYILFPLRIILKQPQVRSEEVGLDVLRCMEFVLSHTEVRRWPMFSDLFNTLCTAISSADTTTMVAAVSEELKLATVLCLTALTKRATESVLQEMYNPVFLPAIGHAVSMLLHMAEKETMRQLRLQCIQCLLQLAQVNRKARNNFHIQGGDTFASFLPGITLTLCKIITGDIKQGQAITASAISAWSKVVCLVIGDKHAEKSQQIQRKTPATDHLESRHRSIMVTRSTEWIKNTASKLNVLIQKIVTVGSHPNWKVRLALVDWAEELLHHCPKSLQGSINHLLVVLVGRLGDDYTNVSQKSRECLHRFQTEHLIGDNKPLMTLLEESLHSLTTQLPRLIRTADDDKKLATLNLLNGYLQLMGPDVSCLLRSYSHLQRLSVALLQVLELDCSYIAIIQEKTQDQTSSQVDSLVMYDRPRKYFKHFVDERIYTALVNTCRLLGYYGDLHLLVDHVQNLRAQSTLNRKPATLMLNEIVMGTVKADMLWNIPGHQKTNHSVIEDIVRSLLDDYLSPEQLNLPTSNQSDGGLQTQVSNWPVGLANQTSVLQVQQLNSNILQVCLILEGVGNFSKVMGSGFKVMLIDVIYPVLEKLGDDSAIVSHSAFHTLLDITSACSYSCVEDLLCSNADYLVNSISLRLRHLSRNAHAPTVLCVLLRYGGKGILPLLHDTIIEIIATLDQYYEERAMVFMRVLHALVTAIQKWYPRTTRKTTESDLGGSVVNEVTKLADNDENDKVEEIREFLLEYHRNKQITSGHLQDDDIEVECQTDDHDIDEVDENCEPEKAEVPTHIKIILQVLERCLHLLSATDPRLRLLVLETVSEACVAMGDTQNELLPMLHKLWPPFIQRFTDEEPLVILKAFNTLQTMAENSGDFLRQRIAKYIFPKLLSFLERQALVSVKKGQAYHYTVNYKYQLAVLKHIGPLCQKLDVGVRQLSPILQACIPYLSCQQPQELQQASLQTCHHIVTVDADLVWLSLMDVCGPRVLNPPHDCFKPVTMSGSQVNNEYSQNIETLLDYL